VKVTTNTVTHIFLSNLRDKGVEGGSSQNTVYGGIIWLGRRSSGGWIR